MFKIKLFEEIEIGDEFDWEDEEPNKYYLIKFRDNWSDEMNIYGFSVMTSEEWSKYSNTLKNHKNRFNYYIGTNEDVEYRNGNELLRRMNPKEINLNEYNFLKENFKSYDGIKFGFFPNLEILEDW